MIIFWLYSSSNTLSFLFPGQLKVMYSVLLVLIRRPMLAPGSTVRDSCTWAPSMGGSKGISRRHCQGHLRAVLDGWLTSWMGQQAAIITFRQQWGEMGRACSLWGHRWLLRSSRTNGHRLKQQFLELFPRNLIALTIVIGWHDGQVWQT